MRISFLKALPTSAAQGKLTLPLQFVRKHLMHLIGKDFELASHPDAEVTWLGSLQPRRNKDREEYTLKGWKLYAEAQKLEAGDQITFELVSEKRLVIKLMHKAITEPVWNLSGEGSHTKAESQAEAAPGSFSPPAYTSTRQSDPPFFVGTEFLRHSKKSQHDLMKGHASLRSIRSGRQAQDDILTAAASMSAVPGSYDTPFGAGSPTASAAPPWLQKHAPLDYSLEQAALRMLAEACQGQLPQNQKLLDLRHWVPEATRTCKAALESPCSKGQEHEPKDIGPAAESEHIRSVSHDDNQPVAKRQKLLADKLKARRRCAEAPEAGRYIHVLEAILGRRSSSTDLLPAPTAHENHSHSSRNHCDISRDGTTPKHAAEGPGAQADAHWMRQLAKSRALPADEANHDLLPTPPGSPAEANVNTAMGEHEAGRQDLVGERVCNDPAFAGAQAEQSDILLDTLSEHSRQAVNAVLGLQLSLGPHCSFEVQGFLTRLLEILRSQLMTLADCDGTAKW